MVSVNGDDAVAGQNPLFPGKIKALHRLIDHRSGNCLHAGERKTEDHKSEEDIHDRPCCNDHKSFWKTRLFKRALRLVVACFLILHHNGAAKGDRPEAIICSAAIQPEKARSKADCKLMYLYAKTFCRDQMARLMDQDEKAKNENRQEQG